MSDLVVYRAVAADDVTVAGDGRGVVLRLLSYGTDYTVSDDGVHTYVERWAPGAFRRSLTHGKGRGIHFTWEHPSPQAGRPLPVGGSTRAWEDDGRLMVEGRISRTSVGDDLVELLRDEVVRGVSLEARVFRSKAIANGFERTEAALASVAFTTSPQYDDAALVAMRSEPAPRPRSAAVADRMATVFGEAS